MFSYEHKKKNYCQSFCAGRVVQRTSYQTVPICIKHSFRSGDGGEHCNETSFSLFHASKEVGSASKTRFFCACSLPFLSPSFILLLVCEGMASFHCRSLSIARVPFGVVAAAFIDGVLVHTISCSSVCHISSVDIHIYTIKCLYNTTGLVTPLSTPGHPMGVLRYWLWAVAAAAFVVESCTSFHVVVEMSLCKCTNNLGVHFHVRVNTKGRDSRI